MDPSRQSMEVRVREVRSGMHPSRFSLRPLSALFPSRSFSPRPPLDSHRRFLTHLTQMRQKGCGRLDEDSPSLNTGGMRRSATTRQGNTGGMRRSATTTRQHRWHAEECDDNKTTQVACGGVRRRPDNAGAMRRSATTTPRSLMHILIPNHPSIPLPFPSSRMLLPTRTSPTQSPSSPHPPCYNAFVHPYRASMHSCVCAMPLKSTSTVMIVAGVAVAVADIMSLLL